MSRVVNKHEGNHAHPNYDNVLDGHGSVVFVECEPRLNCLLYGVEQKDAYIISSDQIEIT